MCVDPNCYCLYEWIGPKVQHPDWRLRDIHYGNYHDVEAWLPTPVIFQYPCEVCFVTIQGPGVTFIDQDTKVNRMTIGGRQWDETSVFLGGVGRIENDDGDETDDDNEDDDTVILTIGTSSLHPMNLSFQFPPNLPHLLQVMTIFLLLSVLMPSALTMA